MKVLLVTRHFPPGGGGGVQRPLKFATHLPALGIETHVLAPDVPGSSPADRELELPTQAWIHRVRYVGPRAGRPAERLLEKQGLARVGTQAALFGRRLLVPDENVPWSTLALLLGLISGIWLQVVYAGDFGLRAPATEPAAPVWIALYGGIAALVLGALLAWRRRERPGPVARQRGIATALAVFLFALPVVVHGFSYWSPQTKRDNAALTPGLIRFLQHDVAARSVVLADLSTSYRATAFAPVYVVAVTPTHAANTRPNELHKRKLAVLRFLAHPTLDFAHRWRAEWIVLTRTEHVGAIERLGLQRAYEDSRFVVFRTGLPLRQ